MSVKRYQPVAQCVEPSYQAQMIEPKVMEFSEGEYVLHSDYAGLKADAQVLLKHLDEASLDCARLKAEVERLADALNKLVKTPPEATGGVRVKVDFWTQYGSRLPSSYEIFWENAAKDGKPSEQKSPSFIEDLGNGVEKHDLLFRYPAKKNPST